MDRIAPPRVSLSHWTRRREMEDEITGISPGIWAKKTKRDVPSWARRLLLYLANHCDLETGRIAIVHRTISNHFGLSLRWLVEKT